MGHSEKRYNIVFLGSEERWEIDRIERRTTLLYRTFSQHPRVGKVLVIDSPRSLPGRIYDRSRGIGKIEEMYSVVCRGMRWSVVNIHEKLWMLSTTALFPERDNVFSNLDRRWLAHKISGLIRKLGFDDSILWMPSPRIIDIARFIPCRLRIFDAVDNLLIHPQLKKFHDKIKKSYEWVDGHADLISIASQNQKAMFPSAAERLFILPNGIDGVFLEQKAVCPADLARIPKPTASYVGVMQDRIHLELLEKVVSALPRHQFVFIGPELVPGYLNPLRSKPNVHILGSKPYHEIPAYIQNSDVCMIPHRINEFTNSMNPLKIYEYLACGRPIVSTAVAGTEMFREHIYVADDPADFAAAIRRALEENSSAREEARRRTASLHTWNHRVDSILEKMDAFFVKNARGRP